VAPLWCSEANSFNPASKYILIKTGKTFSNICQSPGYGSTQSKLLPYSDLSLHAFDRQNYQRLIPYHLADILTFPESVLQHLSNGCFSTSISGKDMFSVALDEAHEMEINLKSKNALNSFSQSSLATLTYYLPFRAKTLHNFKSELNLEREEGMYHRESTRSYIKTAHTENCPKMKRSGSQQTAPCATHEILAEFHL
jgi:hypothetical protein